MARLIIDSRLLAQMAQLVDTIARLNSEKISLIFELISIDLSMEGHKKLLDWDLISETVMDRQLAVQLNKLCCLHS